MHAVFSEFDPLAAKQAINTEVAIYALKREIQNILDSYMGWYDPFSELIQNGLDAIDERVSEGEEDYKPQIWVTINVKENTLVVTDNGTGLSKEKYEQFMAPCFSFKSGNTRGHKGVGATYLGYGFNYIQIATKTEDYSAVGKMTDARKWHSDPNPAGNPKVVHDSSGPVCGEFKSIDKGVSIAVRFDKSTNPKALSWVQAEKAEQWLTILSVKTGIGSIIEHSNIIVTVKVIDRNGEITRVDKSGTEYLWPHKLVAKAVKLSSVRKKVIELFAKAGADFRMPARMKNIECLYERITHDKLKDFVDIDDAENEIIERHRPVVYFAYMHTAKFWRIYNDGLGIRGGVSILQPGVQLAANNMPQGEVSQIPLTRNIGRQNQIHVVVHLDDCRADLGRKGFQKELIEFSQVLSRKLIEGPIAKLRKYLRPVTGSRGDLQRQQQVAEWKAEFEKHEREHPLVIENTNFFLPVKSVAITSRPTREQDVIALFNQLLAGGVIRGIRIMATNERLTYDGMYRVFFEVPDENHIHDQESNPLGVTRDNVQSGFKSEPKILEYKFSLDALIEDIETGTKNSNDIDLVVVWETGKDYQGNYLITSLLDPDNLSERAYHGITHVMTNLNTGQREMDLIVLQELVDFLNDEVGEIDRQRKKYEEI